MFLRGKYKYKLIGWSHLCSSSIPVFPVCSLNPTGVGFSVLCTRVLQGFGLCWYFHLPKIPFLRTTSTFPSWHVQLWIWSAKTCHGHGICSTLRDQEQEKWSVGVDLGAKRSLNQPCCTGQWYQRDGGCKPLPCPKFRGCKPPPNPRFRAWKSPPYSRFRACKSPPYPIFRGCQAPLDLPVMDIPSL